ncbi:MAG: hypothetical protein AB7K68_06435 [Bacteriovoracia bacterium]
MSQIEKWRKVRKMLLLALAVSATAAGGLALWLWGVNGALLTVGSSLCLALGLWVTELLIAVLTGVRKANATAILLLLMGKFLWWGALIAGSRFLPSGNEGAIALGIGAFLFSVLITGIVHYGMPRISDVQD